MDLEEEVKTHTRRVEAGERVRYGQACPRCGAAKEEFFRVHDCRRRKFRLVVERYIQVALSWILRWRCLRCGKRFTDYPALSPCRASGSSSRRCWRRPASIWEPITPTVRPSSTRGCPSCTTTASRPEKRQPVGLAPSTVWRWLSWLGGMPGTLRAAWELIRQKEPNATLHRQPWAVSPGKYRSRAAAGHAGQQAMQLLAVDRVCEGLFGQGIFPRYAISQGWS